VRVFGPFFFLRCRIIEPLERTLTKTEGNLTLLYIYWLLSELHLTPKEKKPHSREEKGRRRKEGKP